MLEVTFVHLGILLLHIVLFHPTVHGVGKHLVVGAHGPRRELVHPYRERHVEVPERLGADLGKVGVGDRQRQLAAAHHAHQVGGLQRVGNYGFYPYAAPNLVVEVLQAVLVFGILLHIYGLPHEAGDVLDGTLRRLHEHLVRHVAAAAEEQVFLVFGDARHFIGQQVHVAASEHFEHLGDGGGYLHLQRHTVVAGKARRHLVVHPHFLVAVGEIGRGAVESGHAQRVGERRATVVFAALEVGSRVAAAPKRQHSHRQCNGSGSEGYPSYPAQFHRNVLSLSSSGRYASYSNVPYPERMVRCFPSGQPSTRPTMRASMLNLAAASMIP